MLQKNFSTETILANLRIDELNEMQKAAIEAAAQNDNVILLSPTGSGKTLAFLLPIMASIDKANKKSQALIIVPSRELALQIESVAKAMGTGLKITTCYGGHKREIEENNLIQPPALLIGTPGRLADHIRRGNITTETVQTLVLDEFDKSLEAGFVDEIAFVISSLTGLQKRFLTSATEAVEIPEFAGAADALRLNFLPENEAPKEALAIQTVLSPDKDKLETLFKLLCYLGARPSIIFCNHRESVERVSQALTEKSIVNTFYHGSMEQRDREVALAKFRNGSSNFLVTTDLAARGLDIPNIRYIIHYHLPATEDVFTHRNGRTARMDASGTAILILSSDEKLPPYIKSPVLGIDLPATNEVPEKPKWTTLFIAAGKKDKVNKVDIVGFFTAKGDLKKEDLGLIEVKDFFSFAAVRKSRVSHLLQQIKEERMKGRKIKIAVAK
ncbi:DEAD/DEAH box helicase [Flavisolibacter ginsenosidimutans]|uniref:DEAD/DEAH box helicase n=1 Tax=Flavisolibacter ginsenosidimutans TaxID=661481 RepID=A0A5B8UME9_9BACT|nr:DEAD/DEAH box helicase [Flavisolibacter ginsenosidimutans]QEC57733.1 DEAD/DEAH box helicase [Flavisolibacter ginsenosidimutans]